MARHWRGLVYLLGCLPTAVLSMLVVVSPAASRAWAGRHRDRAARLLGEAPGGPLRVGPVRILGWLGAHVVTGLAGGLAVVLCAGNALVAAVMVPLWWVFPPGARLRFMVDGPWLSGWGTAVPLGALQAVLLGSVAYWAFPPLARLHARMCLVLLSPPVAEELAERVEVLTETRVEVLNAHGAELRRIERDLHDGTQARLVAIAMRLGTARESLDDDPEVLARLLREAHEGTEEAMAELREVIRTIYPPILADRGLAGALSSLATRSAVATRLEVGELGLVPAAVEAVAYFVIAEALTNTAKHGRATQATVRAGRDAGRLSIEVADDGIGGADERRGTGIAGIRHRVLALDGTFDLRSPAGGPTVIEVSLPCGS